MTQVKHKKGRERKKNKFTIKEEKMKWEMGVWRPTMPALSPCLLNTDTHNKPRSQNEVGLRIHTYQVIGPIVRVNKSSRNPLKCSGSCKVLKVSSVS